MFCRKCGKKISDDSRFCGFCGHEVVDLTDQRATENAPSFHNEEKKDALSSHSVADGSSSQREASKYLLPSPRGVRFLDFVIDEILMGVFSYCVIIAIAAMGMGVGVLEQMNTYVLSMAIMVVYYVISESLWQKTPAKFITRTKVVSIKGGKPEFSQIVGRTFARFIPFEPLSVLASPLGRGWHDTLSGTMVVPNFYTEGDVIRLASNIGATSTG